MQRQRCDPVDNGNGWQLRVVTYNILTDNNASQDAARGNVAERMYAHSRDEYSIKRRRHLHWNTQTNTAYAETIQAIGMARDMLVSWRAERVVVAAGDNGLGGTLLPWLGEHPPGRPAAGRPRRCYLVARNYQFVFVAPVAVAKIRVLRPRSRHNQGVHLSCPRGGGSISLAFVVAAATTLSSY